MTVAAPTFSQIRAQVAAIRRHAADARVFGIQTAGRWIGDRTRTAGSETYCIMQCDSPLAMRAALQEDTPDATAKILLTNLSNEQISYDIRVRVARRKFYPIQNWQILGELFQARQIDPSVTAQGWIAERLLESIPENGYPPVANAVLDAETVWRYLLEQIGLASARPDLVALLKWSMEAENVRRYRSAPQTFREAAKGWISQFAGPATEAVLECLRANERPDALPVGLALGVVFHRDAAGKLDKAAGRMEKYIGEATLTGLVAQRWHAAATEVVRLHLPDAAVRAGWLRRADEILEAIQAGDYAWLSTTSPQGFSQRLARYGQALAGAVDGGATQVSEQVDLAYRAVKEHEQASWDRGSRCLQRVEMSSRLLRWLLSIRRAGTAQPASFSEAARDQALVGGFVDWARYTLRGGEPVRELSDAYTRLLAKALEIREQQNQRFARLLRDWTAAGSTGSEVLPLERVLEEVVGPLSAHAPVLALVIDGMSFAVLRELLVGITRQDWVEIRRADHPPIWPAIAAMPSVTEVCRASLLCGRLRQGQSADEKTGFAEHPALLKHSRSGMPPVLFHKDALQGSDESTLAADVLREIESTRRRVIGVVINAVDDNLLKDDQLDICWTGEVIKVLPMLLYEARAAGRLVVLLSDHGHILDGQTQQRKSEGTDRWRAADGKAADDEVEIAGARVVMPDNHRLIAPWSEKVRYSFKKNGYHGGVTMQEMVVPVAVLSAQDDLPAGWVEATADEPSWWLVPLEPGPGRAEEPSVEPARPPRKKRTELLFDKDSEPVPTDTAVAPPAAGATQADKAPPAPAWLDQLFASPVMAEQKKHGGRTVPQDLVIRQMLSAINEQGGKITAAALARKMELPPFRLYGLVAAVQRVLNVEGYSILTRDEASDTVELNRELLRRQFDLA